MTRHDSTAFETLSSCKGKERNVQAQSFSDYMRRHTISRVVEFITTDPDKFPKSNQLKLSLQ